MKLQMITIPFCVEKRAAPTQTNYAGNGAPGALSYYTTSWSDVAGGAFPTSRTKSLTFLYGNSSGILTYLGFDYVADARL